MSEVPPSRDQPDDVEDSYRRALALDPSRPSEWVPRAVLAHATRLATERATADRSPTVNADPRVVNRTWWRPAVFGTLAAAALAGLLLSPQILTPRAPTTQASPPAQTSRPEAAASPLANNAEPTRTDSDLRPKTNTPVAKQSTTATHHSRAAPAGARADVAASGGAKADMQRKSSPVVTVTVEAARQQPGVQASAAASAISAEPDLTMEPVQIPLDPPAALHRAAEFGDIPGLQTSLDEQVDIDSRDADGRTALMLATLHGQINAVKLLLEHGADPNIADEHGTTPLRAAVDSNQSAIIAALKHVGAR
jgi:Ankyrin repeats (3 copies)